MKLQPIVPSSILVIAGSVLLFFAGPVSTQAASPPHPAERAGSSVATVVSPPVKPALSYSAVHVEGPFIAMTFDDGPNEKLTPELLDVLAERHIHATFFVVGTNAEQYPEILQRAVREGHEIGNHSWSHPAFKKMRDDSVRRELQKTDDAILAAIGAHPVLMRPPYGSITARQEQWISAEFGYRTILWDVDPLDWKRPGPAVVANRIVRETRPGSIILSHDIHPGTIKAMPAAFDQLLAKGFKFVTVSELIAMGKPMAPKQTGEEGAPPPATPANNFPAPPAPSVSPAPGLTNP